MRHFMSTKFSEIIRTDFNGPSKKLVKIGNSKYKFPKEKATFTEAKKICEKDNMDVASFNDPAEASKISEYLNYIGLSDSPVFASLATSIGSTALMNWGQDTPPGGAGTCLVQEGGQMYNASCNQKANFACEERPLPDGVTTTIGPDSLASIEDAVLNFVGGKNILVPKEKATVAQAESMCAGQGLQLMSLDSIAEMDSVQDFLGDIGLSTSTVLTSLKKVTDGGSNWLGDLASAFMPNPEPTKDGECTGLSSLGLVGLSCDTVSNFVCQAPEPEGSSTNVAVKSGGTTTQPAPEELAPAVPEETVADPSPDEPTTEAAAGSAAGVTKADSTTVSASAKSSSSSTASTAASDSTVSFGSTTTGSTKTTGTAETSGPTVSSTNTPPLTANTNNDSSITFYLSNETATYDEAVTKCESMGMMLFVAECSTQYTRLINETQSSPDRQNASYLIALKKINDSFQNPDSTESQPLQEIKNGSGECVSVRGGDYYTTPCEEKSNFACEQMANHSGIKYSVYGRYFVPMGISLTNCEANAYCSSFNANATLTFIDTAFEHANELYFLLKNISLDMTDVHVHNGTSNGTEAAWKYLKDNKQLLDWRSGSPNYNKGLCVASNNVLIHSVECDQSLPFICEIQTPVYPDYSIGYYGKDVTISGFPINYDYAEKWCRTVYSDGFMCPTTFELIRDKLQSSANKGALKNPDVIALGLRNSNSGWKWYINKPFFNSLVNWNSTPGSGTDADCAGIGATESAAVVFPCSEPKRVICY
ncbi:uncharacterized protein LOC135940117 isoform X2 [Cloeon dipterum]|uniref:uncharacterized protein LOC135940117 isoform X2 n=1 Tax=Cloeon dipterum TaxID=197152 RepID=UPI003220084E